jgi:eukaryotic-like serine/threonine-protein kinase
VGVNSTKATRSADTTTSDDAPTRIDTPAAIDRSSASTIELPRPETVLRGSEIDQTRRTAFSGLVFTIVGLSAGPFFGGDPLAKRIFLIALGISLVANALLLFATLRESRYRQRWVIAYFAVAPIMNGGVMYWVGVFSPVHVIFVLNVYTACLAYKSTVARVVLAGSLLPTLALGGAMTLGWLRDPGIIAPTATMGMAGQALVLSMSVLFMTLTYAQARRGRELLVASLEDRDAAVRFASHREALLLEARHDLERAMQAGGFGRFSDQTLGSFRLGPILGRGGMGEVYEATHVDSGEPAAVKMLLPEVIGRPEYVRRFLREVRIAASLESPHVVRVLEIGDESAAMPYLAMERLRGEDLAQILRRETQLDPERVVEMVRQVAEGVGAAAEAGIVHRDLKPQNLFFTESGVWKILDFGVSKLVEGDGTITRGETVGTPQYMAPEQARGAKVDLRADLYALGAIAYRALTGQQPFAGEDLATILVEVLGRMPVRPSALATLPDQIDLVLRIALAKDPAERFQSGADLADALEAAIRSRLPDRERRRAASLLATMPWSPPRAPSVMPPPA